MYAFNIEYHHPDRHQSSMSGSATTLDAARKGLSNAVEYYTKECPVIIDLAEIIYVCPKCNGAGELVKHNKHNRLMVKRTECKACKGNGQTTFEKWEVLPA